MNGAAVGCGTDGHEEAVEVAASVDGECVLTRLLFEVDATDTVEGLVVFFPAFPLLLLVDSVDSSGGVALFAGLTPKG